MGRRDLEPIPPDPFGRETDPNIQPDWIRRQHLIECLMWEIERGNSITGLYSRLLISALVETDERLRRACRALLAQLNEEEEPRWRPSFQDEVRKRMFKRRRD